ncbi:MAG TPA: ribosome assembly RNA-binding protein YhbY [Clostridiales bacterium]|nr:ribosome assembly RNA-binding protein YhbY [Clostridiales bacterium]
MTSKQRSKLISLAMNISATVQIGKNGLTESVFDQISTSLEDHELVKIGVLKTADVTAKSVIAEVAEALNAEPVQAIGNKIVLYRRSQKDGIEHIKLD